MQSVLFFISVLMILHGFTGPQLAPKNLATTLTWVHYRGVLVLVLLMAGNFFCMACPFMLPRDLARRFFKPVLNWPRWLRHKGLALVLFVLVLFSYERFDLWGAPRWTAWLIVAYFAGALLVDSVFKNASFCKYVCPIGQFNFAASTVSPLEIKVSEPAVCARCKTLDCIKGTRSAEDRQIVLQRGCELALFQPEKTGNMDCTFCLDCVYACPHDNIAITTRLPGSELWDSVRRAGIGRFSKRTDIAFLGLLFTFGALLNAFGMISPVYVFQSWLAEQLGTSNETIILGLLFFLALVLEPVLLIGGAAYLTRRIVRAETSLLSIATRYAYAFIPLGLGIWLAHYNFHLLTGLWTFVPIVQQMMLDAGFAFAGDPQWQLTGLPQALVNPLEIGFLSLGVMGSMLVAYKISERDHPKHAGRAFLPWAGLCLLLVITAFWLMNQPMEMRGTFLGA